MTRARALALVAAFVVACSGGGGGDSGPPPVRGTQPQGVVLGAASTSAPGGHRVIGGVLGGPSEAQSAQFKVRGGIQP